MTTFPTKAGAQWLITATELFKDSFDDEIIEMITMSPAAATALLFVAVEQAWSVGHSMDDLPIADWFANAKFASPVSVGIHGCNSTDFGEIYDVALNATDSLRAQCGEISALEAGIAL
jgi:hypothetical protein